MTLTRRAALRAAAAAAASPLLAPPAAAAETGADGGLLAEAIALEHNAVLAYGAAARTPALDRAPASWRACSAGRTRPTPPRSRAAA